MILPLDLDDDREAQLLSRRSSLPVEDVRRQEGPEALHGGTDPAHRSDHVVATTFPGHYSTPKLAAAIGMQDASGELTAFGAGVAHGINGELRSHPIRDGIADDPLREHALDRAAAKVCFVRPMLRDVSERETVRRIGAEHTTGVIGEHGRVSLLPLTPPSTLRGREEPGL